MVVTRKVLHALFKGPGRVSRIETKSKESVRISTVQFRLPVRPLVLLLLRTFFNNYCAKLAPKLGPSAESRNIPQIHLDTMLEFAFAHSPLLQDSLAGEKLAPISHTVLFECVAYFLILHLRFQYRPAPIEHG